jgi:hypothetical protein
MNNIQVRLESARKELLDLTLRNRLLNHRLTKAKGIQITDEVTSDVFRLLVRENRPMLFLSAPEDRAEVEHVTENSNSDGLTEGEPLLKLQEDDDDTYLAAAASRRLPNQLQTAHTSAELQKRLFRTYSDARTYVEEQGVNILYLALGMLEWYESSSSDVKRLAPLILVPVELDRSNARTRFKIRYTEDELAENLSLRAKLKQDFNTSLPDFPVELEDLDTDSYLDNVARSIENHARWKVVKDSIILDFFSFGTFLMYNDLDSGNWSEGSKPTDHPILQSLLGDQGFNEPPPPLSDEEQIDNHITPHESGQVVDADSSQIHAVLDVMANRNLVVQGPPGTGKSQTITNIIAEALNQGKTVLFVAEKMAALEVVKRRLDSVGLGDACLELHSQNTRKKAILLELQRTLELGRPKVQADSLDKKMLLEIRTQLNEYCDAVNTEISSSGLTPYDIFGRLTQLQGEFGDTTLPVVNDKVMETWSGDDFKRYLEQISELEQLLLRIGTPQRHPFWGCQIRQILPSDLPVIKQHIHRAGASVAKLRKTSISLASYLGVTEPLQRQESASLATLAARLLKAPSLTNVTVRHKYWFTQLETLKAIVKQGERLAHIHEAYDEWLHPEAWSKDVSAIQEVLTTYESKWWRILSSKYRQAVVQLQALCRKQLPNNKDARTKLIRALLEAQSLNQALTEQEPLMQTLFGPHWRGPDSSWQYFNEVAEWMFRLYADMKTEQVPLSVLQYLGKQSGSEHLLKLSEDLETTLDLHAEAINKVREILDFNDAVKFNGGELLSQPFSNQFKLLGRWHEHVDSLQDIAAYNQQMERFKTQGLGELLSIASSWSEADRKLAKLIEKNWYERHLRHAFDQFPSLQNFDRGIHELRIERFQILDLQVLNINKVRLAHQHWQNLPKHQAGGQLGILKREFEKKRRHLPIRQLIQNAGNAIQAIKPVFMMSPLSIAMFLPPDSLSFDLIVFDEASQVKPVDAFGALLRGKQAVVVGDRRQLPPTSFFDQIVEEEVEENVTSDLESILSLFVAQNAPERMLRWHYRSQHESLITVSNQQFYDDKLVIFPSPNIEKRELGVIFHHLPDAAYDRGKSRTNRKEAQAVAHAVMDHARVNPDQTLGVAAFSISQTQAIQLELEFLRQQDPSCEPFFNRHPDEPFFVKNLENVQGDERDVIFISVGYGRDSSGKLTMNFGPLNKQGGERRLNVLITRAKRCCKIFSNLTADDLAMHKSPTPGITAFQKYLKYAEHRTPRTTELTEAIPQPKFEEVVAKTLRERGYTVVPKVGSSTFTIDLAVVDEKHPGRYLVGIICDGPSYHQARAARDRDRLRPQVLQQNLKWRIHHIWSTDWFRHPERELQRMVEVIEAAKKSPEQEEALAGLNNYKAPVVREEEATLSNPAQSEEYLATELNIHGVIRQTYDLHEVPLITLIEWVVQIVITEEPVHIEVVMQRIGEAYEVSRLGRRIRASIENAINYATKYSQIKRQGNFLWYKEIGKPKGVRNRAQLPNALRKLELIAPEEIALAAEGTVKNAFGIQRDEIPAAVCSALGFSRTTGEMKQQVNNVIDQMLEKGQLAEQNGFLIVTT